jgi:hypothetical protein
MHTLMPRVMEITGEHHNDKLWRLLEQEQPDHVVTENFHYRRAQIHAELMSRDYIGVLRLWCQLNNHELQVQSPGDAKGFWTDTKLKRLELYTPGKPHANDAVRHLLLYVTFTLKNDYFIRKARK